MKNELAEKQPSSNKFQLAKSGTKISESDIGDLRRTLSYIMNLVGLKSENTPSIEQKAVITDFLLKEKATLTCEELQLAFRCEVNGDLGKMAEHFQNFSLPYISIVLKKYMDYIHGKKLLLNKLDPVPELTEEEISKINGGYLSSVIDELNKCKENKECFFNENKAHIYDYLEKSEVITFFVDEKVKAFQMYVDTLLKMGLTEKDMIHRNEFKRFKENPKDRTNRFYTRCANKAKAQLLREWVNSMILEDYDFNELNR